MATTLDTPAEQTTVADDPRKPWKAIAAAVLAGLTAAGTAVSDGVITPQEWIGIAIAVVATGGAVFGIDNPKAVVSG